MVTLFKNGRDAQGQVLEVYVEDGRIQEIASEISAPDGVADLQVIDCQGKLLAPGLVDIHVHLREPGGEHKETIASGTKAAARGGFTTICAMPNTKPVPDDLQTLTNLQERIEQSAVVKVQPYASISQDLQGESLNDFKSLKEAGAVAFTDDGVGIQTAGMMLAAMSQVQALGSLIVAHTEDNSLALDGVVHQGKVSQRLGLPGIPASAEASQIARDVILAGQTGCPYHICHVSAKESVSIIRWAKSQGYPVTAEVTPHHLLLDEDDIPGPDTAWKMNPPLRSAEDRQALIQGLLDGTIDCIATDHAPHAKEEKAQSMLTAPFGIVGLETAFALLYTHLVLKGVCSLSQLVDWLTCRPADIFKLPAGCLAEGQAADLVLIDLAAESTIDVKQFYSKGHNTPFADWQVQGQVCLTMVDGHIVYQA
ncbi:dihydroorotase [Ignavigranum ruoffiae]|uniref:dihydroorotase n=1 Tax=Ignavigranum ruoffiae TaxID=89093 RepID=UPI0024AE4174|nr:dihydroorotase [Ignavigranum ruoffiae]